jgi:hypothetical protein
MIETEKTMIARIKAVKAFISYRYNRDCAVLKRFLSRFLDKRALCASMSVEYELKNNTYAF